MILKLKMWIKLIKNNIKIKKTHRWKHVLACKTHHSEFNRSPTRLSHPSPPWESQRPFWRVQTPRRRLKFRGCLSRSHQTWSDLGGEQPRQRFLNGAGHRWQLRVRPVKDGLRWPSNGRKLKAVSGRPCACWSRWQWTWNWSRSWVRFRPKWESAQVD